MVDAPVKAAVALSCDIDPDEIAGVVIIDDPRFFEFDRRLEIVENRIDTRGLRVSRTERRPGNRVETRFVRLLDLRKLAEELEWSLPDGFPKRPEVFQSPPPTATQAADHMEAASETPPPPADIGRLPPAKPNWRKWRQVEVISLGDAVALACDINPDLLRQPFPKTYVDGELLFERIELAVVSLMANKIPDWDPPADVTVPPTDTKGDPGAFAGWAKASPRGWELPADFPGAASPTSTPSAAAVAAGEAAWTALVRSAETTSPDGVTISLPHTTDELDALFTVIRANWTTYDDKNPPKQSAIAHEIDRALGLTPQSETKPSRFAEAFVKMIKPHGLRDLDRRSKNKKPT